MGKSYAHPLIVLIALPNEIGTKRVGIAAGRSVGNAVLRNRAKRRLRAAMRGFLELVPDGWDLVILARRPIVDAEFRQIEAALHMLLRRAGLLVKSNDN